MNIFYDKLVTINLKGKTFTLYNQRQMAHITSYQD